LIKIINRVTVLPGVEMGQAQIAKELSNALKRVRFSRRWAASKLGISDVHLSNVVHGKTNASESLLKEMRELTDTLRTSKLFDRAI